MSGVPLPDEPELPCCDYRNHGGGYCACPEHEQSSLHPFGDLRCDQTAVEGVHPASGARIGLFCPGCNGDRFLTDGDSFLCQECGRTGLAVELHLRPRRHLG